jgi:hypothetical protein
MARLGTGALSIVNGRAVGSIALVRAPGYSLDIIAEPDSGGPPILLPDLQFSGGIIEVTIRGPEQGGWRPTLVLSWGKDPSIASASDAMLLVSDDGMRLAVRAFWDTLPSIGRRPGLTTIEDDEEILGPMREMRAAKQKRITQEKLVAWAGTFTISELRGYLKVTGKDWRRDFLDTF